MAVNISQDTAQKIVETVKDICGYDINFFNKEAIIFASTNPERIGDYHALAAEVIKTGETLEIFDDVSYVGTRKGVNVPVFFHKRLSGVIGISGDPDEVRKYAYLAQRIVRLLLKEQEMESSNYSRRVEKTYIVQSLIKDRPADPEYLREYLQDNRIDMSKKYCTVLVKVRFRTGPSNLNTMEQTIYQVFDLFAGGLYAFEYPDSYILLTPVEEYEYRKHLLEGLLKKYGELLSIGVGSSEKLQKQQRSYFTAQIALRSRQIRESEQVKPGIACYDDMDLDILLGHIPEKIWRNYMDKIGANLEDTEVELLRIYFACNRSLGRTAEALYIHKNTLQYKLNRIAEKTGYDPRDFNDGVILYLAIIGKGMLNS